MERKIYFISGHRDITQEEFDKYYAPKILLAADAGSQFVVAECAGVDTMAQNFLKDYYEETYPGYTHALSNVTVYHMFDKPRYLASSHFKTSGGYTDDISRDAAMTKASDEDIALIRPGRWTSGTAQNILRRYEKIII